MRILQLALLIDLLGEPPNRYHPVAWMGSAIGAMQKRAPQQGKWAQLGFGGLIALGGGWAVWQIGRIITHFLTILPAPLSLLCEAVILKTLFSLTKLTGAASEVHTALAKNDLAQARFALAYHLVSRDTSDLNESQVAAATIESVAENFSDGFVAPLTYYLIGGLPAALLYRYANTADAMLGYRDEKREYLGKIPARFDDLLNLLPARLSAGAIIAASTVKFSANEAFTTWRSDATLTTSPNAGHPMSAAAGGLQVELEKTGHYKLGAGYRKPKAHDIEHANLLIRVAAGLFVLGVWLINTPSRSKDS